MTYTQHPRRRALLWGLPLALAGCGGLAERPFAERRQWPLLVQRPTSLPKRDDGAVLELREIRAGAGLDQRGLQALQADGSIQTAFYEEWAVPPAQAVEDSLRQWLAESGQFAAVTAPGGPVTVDLVLDGVLTALWTDPAHGVARATIAFTVTDLRPSARRVLLQTTVSAMTQLGDPSAPAGAQAQSDALAGVFRQIEAALAAEPLIQRQRPRR